MISLQNELQEVKLQNTKLEEYQHKHKQKMQEDFSKKLGFIKIQYKKKTDDLKGKHKKEV